MSATIRLGGAVCNGAVAMQRVQELDAAELSAIRDGDWARLGHVLDEQRELWRALVSQLSGASDDSPRQDTLAAIAELHQVRRRNHGLITAQVSEFRRRLAGIQLARDGRAAYRETAHRPM